jgi:hypothetical protein
MSDGELSRLEVLRDLDQKRLTTQAAAQLLGLERRSAVDLGGNEVFARPGRAVELAEDRWGGCYGSIALSRKRQ